MNTAVAESGAGNAPAQGIGFAIAINTIKPLLPQLQNGGTGGPSGGVVATPPNSSTAYLGVVVETVTPSVARQKQLSRTSGAVVVGVAAGGPAAAGGLRVDDVIVSFANQARHRGVRVGQRRPSAGAGRCRAHRALPGLALSDSAGHAGLAVRMRWASTASRRDAALRRTWLPSRYAGSPFVKRNVGGGMSPEVEDPAVDPAVPVEPVGHVRVVYLGPVAPHWEVQSDFGDPEIIDAFRDRALARLVLLPPHDPQFRRNRERVVRDAERENLALDWDLGFPEETSD